MHLPHGLSVFLAIASLFIAADAFYLPGVAPHKYAPVTQLGYAIADVIDFGVSQNEMTRHEAHNQDFLAHAMGRRRLLNEEEHDDHHPDGEEHEEQDPHHEEVHEEHEEHDPHHDDEHHEEHDPHHDEHQEGHDEDPNHQDHQDIGHEHDPQLEYDHNQLQHNDQGDDEEEREPDVMINNHLDFIVKYHEVSADAVISSRIEQPGILIVGFEVKPLSVRHKFEGQWDPKCAPNKCNVETCDLHAHPPMIIKEGEEADVLFTYDVQWEHSDVKWASRWDLYLTMHDDQIHWFSIVNAFIIVIFLSSMVAMIMLRILRKDLYRYNQLSQDEEEAAEEAREETGWKLVYGDVFRPPVNASFFAVLIGSGVQIFLMLVMTLGFAVLGMVSPSNRGSLMTCLLVSWMVMGVPAGYASARMCRFFRASDRIKNTIWTSTFVPGTVFSIFFVLDLFIWGEQSAGAVPFGTIFALLLLWFGISSPLVFCGSFLGFRKDPFSQPTRTNAIPRQIPEQAWFVKSGVSILMGGILPFGAVFVELFFIVSSIWLHRFYYMFGFLALVVLILVITCAEISVVMTYFQLCNEDYHWWWRSFLVSACSALYVMLYGVYYYFSHVHSSWFVSGLIFFGYMGLGSFLFAVFAGVCGFVPTLWFVRKIYGAVKID